MGERTRFSIGLKLGLSAAAGVLLVSGLAWQTRGTLQSIETASAAQFASAETVERILEAEANMYAAISEVRQMRLAYRRDALQRAGEAASDHAARALKLTTEARGLAGMPENRERLARAETALSSYRAAILETQRLRAALLDGVAAETAASDSWRETRIALLTSPALADRSSASDLVTRTLAGADASAREANIGMWRFLFTHDADLIERTRTAAAAVKRDVDGLRAAAEAAPVRDDLNALSGVAAELVASLERVVSSAAAIDEVQAKRTGPLRQELTALFQATRVAAEARATAVAAEARGTIEWGSLFSLIGSFAVIALLIGSAVVTAWTVARPVRRIGETLTVLASGDKSISVPFQSRGDEVGVAARAAENFRLGLIRLEALEAEQKEAEANRAGERRQTMLGLADDLEGSVGGVVNALASSSTELEAAADALSRTSEQTSTQSQAVAASSEEASANVRAVAAACEELSSSVAEIGSQVARSAELSRTAAGASRESAERMKALLIAADEIGSIAGMINDIASRTNLLALNATIEAARAGEAGRGFAIVASEVKGLADQTAKATVEITAQIGAIQQASSGTAEAIAGVGRGVEEMREISSAIAAAVEEQSAATSEIARNIQEALVGVETVTQAVVTVRASASEASAAAAQVLTTSGDLAAHAGALDSKVSSFIATVRVG